MPKGLQGFQKGHKLGLGNKYLLYVVNMATKFIIKIIIKKIVVLKI